MSITERLWPRLVGWLCGFSFVSLAMLYSRFVLDDAYIGFRFSRHLLDGHGLVWNVGESPVEGFTSFLWVVLNSLAMRFDLEPAMFSKILGGMAGLGTLALLAAACRHLHWGLGLVLVGALGFNPAFAFVATQGLETGLAAFLLALTAALALRAAQSPKTSTLLGFFAAGFLSALTRPEALAFVAGAALGLVYFFITQGERKTVVRLSLCGDVFLMLGVVYMLWRFNTFGHLFPNTFYVKVGTGSLPLRASGALYLGSFILAVLLPYLAFFAYLFARHKRPNREQVMSTQPVLAGCLLFAGYLLTIDPIQGFLWRFVLPIYPALLLVIAAWLPKRPQTTDHAARLYLIVALLLGAWNLRLLPQTLHHHELRSQSDRVAAGHALAGLDGTMLTSAAGALPYYSGWRSVDVLGLTSAEVAHHGLSRELLEKLEPDLVVIRTQEPETFRPKIERQRIATDYVLDRGFVAVAAIHRSFGNYLCYFARPDSPLFTEIRRRLLEVPGAEYGDLSHLLRETDILINRSQEP